ncbi:hypothetical protein [uncultured Desulfosarcina sp.]|uniref:hypothetical protein n=1 Tax=uncultured Desulfosarcina sp. TaxID=218289 RepID=UPI0029C8080A|nr:hypothetical protein [uncultured Desulfosarcina sp.]
MSDATSENKRHLLARIIEALENGGGLTDAILDYIDAALFSPEPDRLASFLTDDANSERDSLLDLIFFPDQAAQMNLEPLLEAARYSVEDKIKLHDRLMARAVHARVNLPDGRKLVSLLVPDFIKSQYLERLNIAWQMDPQVATAIEKCLPAALGPIVKVRLRNAGIGTGSGHGVFLCRFFERMADSHPDYLACLDLALSILQTVDDGVDVYDRLVEHKRSLFRSLQQARRFETLLGQSNMETLMLQGVRAPHVSPNTLMQHMRRVDLICFGIFGKTEAIDMPIEEPVRQVSDLDTAEAAVQLLMC